MQNSGKKSMLYFIFLLVIMSSCKKNEDIIHEKKGLWKVDSLKVELLERDTFGNLIAYSLKGTSTKKPFDYFFIDFDKNGIAKVYAKFTQDSIFSRNDFFSQFKYRHKMTTGAEVKVDVLFEENWVEHLMKIDGMRFRYYRLGQMGGYFNAYEDFIDLETPAIYYEDSLYRENMEIFMSRAKKKELPN